MLKKYAVVVVVRHRAFLFQAFIATGFNLILTFDPTPAFNPAHRQCDYEKEPGKVREQQIHSTIKRLKFLAIPATCYLVHI